MVDNYKEKGYENKKDYLESLSDEYCIPLYVIEALSDILGPSEDFDGLINELEDLCH